MASLKEIVYEIVQQYAVKGLNSDAHLLVSPDGVWLTVIDVALDANHQRFTATSLVVQLRDDYVIIEHDDNNKPLVDALIQAGIERHKIILAYAGEIIPEVA